MKNFASVSKQFVRIGGQFTADLKTAFKANLAGKRSPHYDNMLVAIIAALLIKGEKITVLKTQMTKARMDTAKIVAMVDRFNHITRPLPF